MKLDLTVSPYTYIPKPKFGDLAHSKRVAEQWAEWRMAIDSVIEIFFSIKRILPPSQIERLKQPADRIRRDMAEMFHWNIKSDDWILAEAARRAVIFLEGKEGINANGKTKWEQDIYDTAGRTGRSKASGPEHDSELFASTEVAELRRTIEAQAAEITELKARLGVGV